MQFKYPICDICNKEVEEMTFFENFHTGNWVVIVRCHGDEDRVIIPRNILMKFPLTSTSFAGRAFTTKRITEGSDD